jgi:serine/threonine protein kinase
MLVVERIEQQLGDYRLLRLLGKGGFANVYLGEQIYLKRPVAIKLLHTQVTEFQQEDFLKEAQHLANLAHPHIVRVLHFAVEKGVPYLVMEYAPNGTLRKRHPHGSQLPLEAIIFYVKWIADALQYIHDQKLVHRDVKPENMLLGANQEILLSDFGLVAVAHATASLTLEGQTGGTPLYMAPEQLQGKPRPASDQYSLGVVVYEWLCGQCPFNGPLAEVVTQHLHVPPPSLQKRLPKLSPAIERVVFTALAKDPKQRFASVREFAVALEQAIQVSSRVEFSNAQPYISKGDTLFKMARYREALAIYEHAISLEPSNAQFHVNKGNVLFKMAKYMDALASYERATQLEPANAQFHRHRAKAALSLKRFEEALISYEEAINLEPGNPYLYKERGDILFDLSRFEEALIYFEHAIDLHPGFGLAYLSQSKAFEQLAQQYYDRFKKQSQQALEKAREFGVS